MSKLTLPDFKYIEMKPSLGWLYQHFLPDGREICLESCFAGYCVAIYTKTGRLIGAKKCTRMNGILDSFFNNRALFKELDLMAQQKALEIANNII